MTKSFDELAKKIQADWTPEAWAVYDAAGESFKKDLEELDKKRKEEAAVASEEDLSS